MKLKTPIIIVNFKTYLESTGQKAVELAKAAEKVPKKQVFQLWWPRSLLTSQGLQTRLRFLFSPSTLTPSSLATARVMFLLNRVKEAGAVGTLINHSERQLKLSEIDAIITLCREKELVSCVCANNPTVSAAVGCNAPGYCFF